MKKVQMIIFIVLGLVFLGVAAYYLMTPAGQLAQFMPGYAAGSTDVHTKHALAAVILALGSGVLAWFSMGKKSDAAATSEPQE